MLQVSYTVPKVHTIYQMIAYKLSDTASEIVLDKLKLVCFPNPKQALSHKVKGSFDTYL